MSQNTTKFARCCYFELTTCFGPYSGPSSGHKSIYLRKLYSVSHKIYQSKIQRDIFHHHHHVPEGLGMLSCSLILKMKLVPPSLPRSSYDSSSFWFILQCLFSQSVCVHPLYTLQPLFLVIYSHYDTNTNNSLFTDNVRSDKKTRSDKHHHPSYYFSSKYILTITSASVTCHDIT